MPSNSFCARLAPNRSCRRCSAMSSRTWPSAVPTPTCPSLPFRRPQCSSARATWFATRRRRRRACSFCTGLRRAVREFDRRGDMRLSFDAAPTRDPLEDRVILWTKVTPNTNDNVTVSLNYVVVASNGNLTTVVKNGITATSSDVGYTVKVDVPGLIPATRYWYQFTSGDTVSPTGATLTLPTRNATLDRVQFALVSCANFQHGYFHAYGAIANRSTDFQAVLALGDVGIYEYDTKGYPPAGGELPPDRDPVPDKNLDTLDDYRTRYSQYQTDVSQQAMMRSLPIIAIWDDHEFADNAWSINATNGNVSAPGGANNQNDRRDGPWGERRLAAMRAFHENIPIRPSNATGAQYRIYRSFRIGTTVDLLMLDTRMEGRDEQGSGRDANRELMGPEQEAWLHSGLINSNATWLIGNQVMFAKQPNSILWYEPPIANDGWVGYPLPRQRLLNVMVQNKVNNTIMVTATSTRRSRATSRTGTTTATRRSSSPIL
ncbi:hypothetical protein AMAG_12899 [Allomyces macrogynus ATCC 38327]|uniref:PhoD-like phosphatase metallophosphatase domain-containing protein n=1 Tax=Allomyces macrogynus (strain ATCC 38327) TaxID=578462 RepID=A0A0L0T0E3_ALLM3|nr:hypothetical protein AMAG_12899 [Allomyces macrogynus ATCC 38327]|eukprot:KNE68222.1 hypothetical protein AMAG_12899 [Allomyces macrogynus ATCC 38327]